MNAPQSPHNEQPTEHIILDVPYIPGPDGIQKAAAAEAYDELTGEAAVREVYGDIGRIAGSSALGEKDEPLPPLQYPDKPNVGAGNMPSRSRFRGSLRFLLGGKRAGSRNESPAEKPAVNADDPEVSTAISPAPDVDYDFSTDIELARGRNPEDDFAGRADRMRAEHGLELLTPEEVGKPAPLTGVGDRAAYEYRQAQAGPGVDNRTYMLPKLNKNS